MIYGRYLIVECVHEQNNQSIDLSGCALHSKPA